MELFRGIRDYTYYSPVAPIFARMYGSRELVVNDIKILFSISNTESLRRGLGHGEIDVIADILREVSSEDTVWDIGANQGTYSLFLGKLNVDVHAFEPGSSARKILKQNIELNNIRSITIHPFALGAENKSGILKQAHRSGVRQVVDYGDGESIEIKRGEDISIPDPDILKIDVEGAEVDVLHGLETLIDSSRVCYVEIHGNNRSAVTKILERNDFQISKEYSNILKYTHKINN
ncbi:FkbM family methyltransferase [Halorubrum sp. Ea8]|uniref:FkbM family methyltransferase n=1 Tax=Halorubrum sp. Ea8 TaxID=1383841 RepID=UPI00159522D1|nr:FkbM family methyltransferase [Halorubrum sp. Ea8]